MKKELVSVVVPAKNESENLRVFLPDLLRSIKQIKAFNFEVIVVCNNCSDDSASIVKGNKVRLLEKTYKKASKSKALLDGFAIARGDIFVMMDADGSHLHTDVRKLLAPLTKNRKIGLVVGSRITGKSDDETKLRKLGGVIFNYFTNLFFKTKLTDAINGFKAFRRDIFDDYSYKPSGYAIEIELIAHALKSGYKVSEVPSFEAMRMSGKPKSKIVADGWLFLQKIFVEGISYRISDILKSVLIGGFLFFIIFLVFNRMLSLGLYGDDWQYIVFSTKPQYQNWLVMFLGSYGNNTMYMKILNGLFGHENFSHFYITSLVLRFFAALGIYTLVSRFLKSRLAGVASATLFAITSVGVQTSDWVFNSPVYLSILFACLYLVFLSSTIEMKFPSKADIFLSLFFVLAIVLSPNRMNGLIVVSTGIFLVSFTKFRMYRKHLLFRFLFIVLVFMVLGQLGFFGTTNDNSTRLSQAREIVSGYLANKQYMFLLNPLVTLSNIFIPSSLSHGGFLYNQFANVVRPGFRFFVSSFYLFVLTIGGIFIFTISKLFLKAKQKIFFVGSGAVFGVIAIGAFIIQKLDYRGPSQFESVSVALTGGLIISLCLGFFVAYFKDKARSFVAQIILFTIPAFTLIPALYNPESFLPTNHRYLISNAITQSLFWGLVLSKIFIKRSPPFARWPKVVVVLMFAATLYMNLRDTHTFIDYSFERHPADAVINIWTDFREFVGDGVPKVAKNATPDSYASFLFTPKDEESALVMGSVVDFSSTFKLLSMYDKFRYSGEIGYAFFFKGVEFNEFNSKYDIPVSRQYVFEVANKHLVDESGSYRQGVYEIK